MTVPKLIVTLICLEPAHQRMAWLMKYESDIRRSRPAIPGQRRDCAKDTHPSQLGLCLSANIAAVAHPCSWLQDVGR